MSDKQLDIAKYTRHLKKIQEHLNPVVAVKATEILNGLVQLILDNNVTGFTISVTQSIILEEFSLECNSLNYIRDRIIELFEGTV
jgi:hypothetical protein